MDEIYVFVAPYKTVTQKFAKGDRISEADAMQHEFEAARGCNVLVPELPEDIKVHPAPELLPEPHEDH